MRRRLIGGMAAGAMLIFIAPASANILGNASFELPDASGGDVPDAGAPWFNFGAPGTRFTTQSVPPDSGLQTLKMFGPFDFIGGGTGFGQTHPAAPGEFFEASIMARNDSSDPIGGLNFALIKIEYLDAGFNFVGGSAVPGFNVFESLPIDASAPFDTWIPLATTSAPAPAETAFVNFIGVHVQLGDGAGGFAGGSVFLDSASLVLIPEPSSLMLLGLGAMGLVCHRRRQRP